MTIDTPSLSELVAELREYAEEARTSGNGLADVPHRLLHEAADTLSRLSGNGGGDGGAASPSASLEEDVGFSRTINLAPDDFEAFVAALDEPPKPNDKLRELLQGYTIISQAKAQAASERLPTPIDDGAVERGLDAFYGPAWRKAPGPNLLRAQMRSALRAAHMEKA